MAYEGYPEGKDWQTTCRVCSKVKCPKPEKVADWMRSVISDTHFRNLDLMRTQEGNEAWTWRDQTAAFEATIQCRLISWSYALQGVCPDCLEVTAPEAHALLDDPPRLHAEARRRWLLAVAPPTPALQTVVLRKDGTKQEVPCAWKSGGLAVALVGSMTAEGVRKAEAENKWGGPQVWAITHEASGTAIAAKWDHPDAARQVAEKALLPMVDWTQSMDTIRTTIAGCESHARMIHELRSDW